MARKTSRDSTNYLKLLSLRQVDDRISYRFQSRLLVNDSFISRLGLEKELEGHTGCVNCLEWNETGSILASASDDAQFILWNPFCHKRIHSYETGHRGNIFTVKFMPKTRDNIIVTGAGDCRIRVHDVELKETILICSCHVGRVKRIATTPSIPSLFWSASEDGTIMEFDLRAPHSCLTLANNVLINFAPHLGRLAEAKCIAINPMRPELLAVGANDPYIRVYDRRMIRPVTIDVTARSYRLTALDLTRTNWERYQYLSSKAENNLPRGCVQYFVAGHLPSKHKNPKKKYRDVASTYLTFSNCGNELLVNLGAEQIYLFDINNKRKTKIYDSKCYKGFACNSSCSSTSNGYYNCCQKMSRYRSGRRVYGTSSSASRPPVNVVNPAKLEALKMDANNAFQIRHYTSAIRLYNKAVNLCPDWALLYGNRAAAYMKRGWDGDVYAALRDCNTTLQLDPSHMKAHFRLAKCLFELQFIEEACKCLAEFKLKFPDQSQSRACKALDMDIRSAKQVKQQQAQQPPPPLNLNQRPSSLPRRRYHRATMNLQLVSDDDEPVGASGLWNPEHQPWKEGLNNNEVSDQEKFWRENACDYETRYCGHCNTTTDIKEANFFGSEGQYIIAGSDDGSFFIWDRYTTNIIKILQGDGSIVNCLQPHPASCLLATSGIDPVVRLWSPRPEDGSVNERMVLNLDDVASENQKRMNADPFEMVLINMGFRLSADSGEGDDASYWVTSPTCRTS